MLNDDEIDRLEVADKIRTAIASLGDGGKVRLANKCGVTPQAITGWGKTGQITFINLVKVAVETNKSLDYFAPSKSIKIAEPASNYVVDCKTDNQIKALAILEELFIYQQNKWLALADEYLKEAREIRAEIKIKQNL